MSDPTNNNPRPQTSSAWGPSGTSARSVTVDSKAPEPDQTVLQPGDAAAIGETFAEAQAPYSGEHAAIYDAADEATSPHYPAPQPNAEAASIAAPSETIRAEAPAAGEPADPVEELVQQAAHTVQDTIAAPIAAVENAQDQAATIFDQVSHGFKAALSDAGSDAALITFTLLEFAQANARNNYQLAQDYAGVRSVPEIVNVQAAYFRRQMELMNQQAGALRKIAAEITSKKAAQMQAQIARN